MKTVRFRESEFIDFNSGQVKIAPMDLTRQFQIAGATGPEAGIRLFQCQIDVWMLGVAVQILKEIESHEPPSTWSHAAYGLISVVFPYFEMIGKTLNPGSKRVRTAGQDFNYGFCDVYPEFASASGDYSDHSLSDVTQFRDRIRNGMYHLGGTKFGLRIHNNPNLSVKDFDRIGGEYLLNPHAMTRTVVDHFPGFIDRLRDPSNDYDQLRVKFQQFLVEFHRP